MKKFVSLIACLSISSSLLVPIQSNAVHNSNNPTKEIIIKYRNNSDFSRESVKSNFLKKHKKFEKKKEIYLDNEKIEVVRIDENDSIENALINLKNDLNVEYAVPNSVIKIDPLIKSPTQNNSLLTKQIEIISKSQFKPSNDTNTNPYFPMQWGISNQGQSIYDQKGIKGIDLNISKVSKKNLDSCEITVGVLDTGIDISHEDLKNNIYKNTKEIPNNKKDDDQNGYVDDVNGWDFINNDNKVFDNAYIDSHGTHVAGIIASQNNKVGIVGVAPKVKILPLKFIENDGQISDVIEAIQYGKKMGVKVFNCSWALFEKNTALQTVMKNSNAIFIVAAGNYASNVAKSPVYPACYDLPNIISVSAIDNKGQLWTSSNYGNEIDVVAPGVGIYSTIPNNQYMFADGTSMATPFVSGVVALLKNKNPDMKPLDIINIIKGNVTKIPALKGKVNTSGIPNTYEILKTK